MTAVPTPDEHRCVYGPRCYDKVDGKPRVTEKPGTFCKVCMSRVQQHIEQLPEQWIRLHHMIGDRHAGVDVNIRRPKPGGTVPLNLHVDSLLGFIGADVSIAAEVVSDKLNTDTPNHADPAKQVQACARLVAPNLDVLINARGVGGRDDDDPTIDVMSWLPNGTYAIPTTTTGVELLKLLAFRSSLAYFTLGMTRARIHRDIPCARCRARQVGRWAGADDFDCQGCGTRIPEEDVRRQDRVLIELHKRGMIQPEAS